MKFTFVSIFIIEFSIYTYLVDIWQDDKNFSQQSRHVASRGGRGVRPPRFWLRMVLPPQIFGPHVQLAPQIFRPCSNKYACIFEKALL